MKECDYRQQEIAETERIIRLREEKEAERKGIAREDYEYDPIRDDNYLQHNR